MESRSSRPSNNAQKKSVLQSLIETPDNQEKKKLPTDTAFEMRPEISKRFKSTTAKEIIGKVLHELLYDMEYATEEAQALTHKVATTVRNKLEGEMYERYKLVVNVVLGERKGEGVKVGARCLWDPETDSYATNSFINESLFCVVTVFGVLFY